MAHAPPSAEQACGRDDDPDDERGQAGQQQDFMEDSAHLQPQGLRTELPFHGNHNSGLDIWFHDGSGKCSNPGRAGRNLGAMGRVECLVQPRFRYAMAL
jgi:hypothetical protein